MIRSTVEVCTLGVTAASIMGNGKTGNSMGRVFTGMLMVTAGLASGMRANAPCGSTNNDTINFTK